MAKHFLFASLLTSILSQFTDETDIILQDLNIVIVTDVHGWLASHKHNDSYPSLTASYGDVSSFATHLKELGQTTRRGDVFFVNNGDHVEGSGLSDATMYTEAQTHGAELFPIISKMPFDVLTIGNHELYEDSTVNFMVSSGFINSWDGRYLTSNTRFNATNERIGEPYTILEGDVTRNSYLFFGFLYHMTDSCPSITVTDPADEVEQSWFSDALSDGLSKDVKAVVIMSHMDMVDKAVFSILEKIRSTNGYEHMPVQFVTGHSHYRGFHKLDDRASSYEAGHYLDTIGLLTMDLPHEGDDTSQIWFECSNIDANKDILMQMLGMNEADFDTELGINISVAIDEVTEKLQLNEIVGCPTAHYICNAGMNDTYSLYYLYMNSILPSGVTPDDSTAVHITNTGTLRYDVYDGKFFYNDVFAVAPFSNTFAYVDDLTAEEIISLTVDLNSQNEYSFFSPLPPFVTSDFDTDENVYYKLFFNNYDQPKIVRVSE